MSDHEEEIPLEMPVVDPKDPAFLLGTLVAEVRITRRQVENNHKAILGRVNDHETRITALERWRWMLVGGFLVLVAIVGFIEIPKLQFVPAQVEVSSGR